MATRYYGVNVGGQDAPDVLAQASTTSRDIELAVIDTNLPAGSITKREKIVIAIEALRQKVLEDTGL